MAKNREEVGNASETARLDADVDNIANEIGEVLSQPDKIRGDRAQAERKRGR
jgi:hypothetical protein